VTSTADALLELAAMLRRLRPDWRDAERFYELRSEITGRLTRLARSTAVSAPLAHSAR
jgi:hypothetical protein